MTERLGLPPLALYIHIPWCEKKCPYCDFNSHVSAVIPENDYIDALLRDARSELPAVQGRRISSIFIGGGTPSLFSAAAIARLLEQLAGLLVFADDIEITMEANPGSSEQARFVALRAAGINRLSLGVQSFSSLHLQQLGRIHDGGEALAAVNAAQQAGFERINIDLMHGLPGQQAADALADLQQALALGVDHVSWYQLTIEPNTEFYRYPPRLPAEDTLADIQQLGQALLADHGLAQYEVSAFARPGQQARHNRNYWEFGDYLAIGAGAHGKISWPAGQRIERYHKTRLPRDYLARNDNFVAGRQPIAPQDRLFECLMNGLRLTHGVAVSDVLARTGCSLHELQKACRPLVEQQLLVLGDRICTSETGFMHLNTVLERLLQN